MRVSPTRKRRARATPPPSPLTRPTPSEAERQRESWELARALQASLGAESLDEASLRLAQHLFHVGLLLDESLRKQGDGSAPLERHGLRMLLLDVLLAWDDVGLPNTSLWNLFDGLGSARGARALPPPAPEPNPFRAFHAAFARLRRHAGKPTMAAAMLYAWAALARCLESSLTGLARGIGRPEASISLTPTRVPKRRAPW